MSMNAERRPVAYSVDFRIATIVGEAMGVLSIAADSSRSCMRRTSVFLHGKPFFMAKS